ncbi:MAG: hypothetical protein HKN18_00920 [Silicimonas sp.]|nr:hypothetical protein [Silicimonas sp.]
MKNSLKAALTAVMLSSVALVPAAAVSVLVTADAAHAKSENAGGKGNAGNKGKSGDKKGGKSSKASKSKGKSGKSLSSTRAGKRVEGMFRKLTGQDKKTTRRASKARIAKTDLMHPSNLGNMNGAMNANTNAVLAHIRNGNTNGPVGHLAALAVANVNADGAQEIVDLQDAFDTLDDELAMAGYDSVADYYAAREGVPGIDPITEIDTATDPEAEAIDRGFGSYQDYLDQVAGTPGVEMNDPLEEAISDLGGDPTLEEPTDITAVEPDPADVDQAEMDLEAQTAAEQDILDYWNKNTGDENDEAALLDKLNERLAAEDAAIRDAMGVDDEADAACEADCDEPIDEEDVVLIVE